MKNRKGLIQELQELASKESAIGKKREQDEEDIRYVFVSTKLEIYFPASYDDFSHRISGKVVCKRCFNPEY